MEYKNVTETIILLHRKLYNFDRINRIIRMK